MTAVWTRRKKLRFVRQRDAMQCGVAALAMICSIEGKAYSADTLGRHCHPTAEGVSMRGIAQGAEAVGLRSEAVKLTAAELAAINHPAILHWNQNHFVVFLGMTRRGRFRIADPAKGCYTCTHSQMQRCWVSQISTEGDGKGVAMFFEPTPEFGSKVEEPDGERCSFRFLLGYIGRYRRYFAHIAAGLFLGSILQLAMPFLTQWIVDYGITRRDIGFIWLILAGELMIVAGCTATDFLRRWMLLHISMRVNISLLSDFFIKLLKLPMEFFDTRLTGDLLQRMSDHSRVQSFLTQQTLGIMFTMLSFIVFGTVLLVYNSLVFGAFLAGSIIYGLWIAMFLNRRKVLDYEIFERQAVNQEKTFQFITSMQEIKLQNCSRRRRWEWEDCQADLFETQMKALRMQQTQEAGSIFINEIKNIVITVLAASAVIDGSITLGAMLAIQFIVGQLNSPVEQLMAFAYSMQDVKISLDRINEVHCVRNEENSGGKMLHAYHGSRSLTIENLSFRYDPHNPAWTLEDISLHIPHGKITAIVGASGSGKTTLVKILLGYYAPQQGSVKIGSEHIADHSMDWWRSRCGVVMQDGVIFSESIARNIAVDDNEIDHDRLIHAARIACIHHYVMSLPLRYDTKIGRDGTGLSQGQKQRILIARAVYKDPDFIFLDEATNSLDADNERAIVENLDTFYRGRTVVVVAHRLSTVRHAHNIVVLSKGRIVETGTHEELTRLQGAYYSLVKNQLELGG